MCLWKFFIQKLNNKDTKVEVEMIVVIGDIIFCFLPIFTLKIHLEFLKTFGLVLHKLPFQVALSEANPIAALIPE